VSQSFLILIPDDDRDVEPDQEWDRGVDPEQYVSVLVRGYLSGVLPRFSICDHSDLEWRRINPRSGN